MASRDSHDGYLDATTDREVVFCHACSYEWYRDDHGLMCPHCESETTEIVSADNDPRNMDGAPNPSPSDPSVDPGVLRVLDITSQLLIYQAARDFLVHGASTRSGDGFFSQEALDRLMEANLPSNAAPPATEEALAKLDRKTVDEELLESDGKVECSICIDEMKEGETVAFLPCRHGFHEDCVVLWLKEHNTCPVCRTPIEKNERGQGHGRESNNGGPRAHGLSNSPPYSYSPVTPTRFSRRNSDQSRGFGSGNDGGADTHTGRAAADMVSAITRDSQPRPSNPSQSRLNEAIPSVANIQRDRDGDGLNQATASIFSSDTRPLIDLAARPLTTSRHRARLRLVLYNKTRSPKSPRATNLAVRGARMRQRRKWRAGGPAIIRHSPKFPRAVYRRQWERKVRP